MSSIKDILYVKFKVPDLIKQDQFLQDFGFETRPSENLLMARGTDTSQYVYLAELGEPAFVGIGFEANLSTHDRRILADPEHIICMSTFSENGYLLSPWPLVEPLTARLVLLTL